MATVPSDGDGSAAREGYYPDPSIPGYVRYWNGVSWVPGTSRPAPVAGEAPPTPPPGAAPAPAPSLAAVPPVQAAPAEETGPVFLDEPEGSAALAAQGQGQGQGAGSQPVWHADAAHQSGFGGDQDRRVSWGRPVDPRGLPEAAADPRQSDPRLSDPRLSDSRPSDPRLPDPRRPDAGRPMDSAYRADPGQQPHPAQSAAAAWTGGPVPHQQQPAQLAPSVPPAAVEPPPARAQLPAAADPVRPAAPGRADGGYVAPARMPSPAGPQPMPHPASPSPVQPSPVQPSPVQPSRAQQQPPAHTAQPGHAQQSAPVDAASAHAASVAGSPMTAGPGGGAASWAQQVHQLAQPDPQGQARPQEPVVPWKPPVADPFLQAAQAQASARPAGLGRRLIARLVDTVLLGAVVGGLAVPLLTRVGDHIQEKIDAAKLSGRTVTVYLLDGTTAGFLGIVLGAFLVLGLLYEALPTAKWGRTLGKKLCGVQVRGIESYEPPTFGQAARRWLVYGVLGLLAVGVVNVAWCLFDRPWRQCWHDKAARTFVAQD
ncbi:RDD family protein [Streptomyces sp. NPDC048416]|uniref:RDD family protein n=1 Tax=Streptomyces sp. NPDC048416 TaxID=3365546 RepID=UPI00371C6B7B